MRLLLTFLLLTLHVVIARSQDFASSSVLSTGTWRKVSVSESGIYSLSAATLRAMGFSDMSSVRIYGAAGHQQSFVAGADSRDDLRMLPTFRTNEAILFYAEGPHSWTVDGTGAYTPSFNSYSHKAYYYITTSSLSDSPQALPQPSASPQVVYTSYDSRTAYYDLKNNLDKSGRQWVGDACSASMSVHVSLPTEVGNDIYLRGQLVAYVLVNQACTVSLDDSSCSLTLRKRSRSTDTYTTTDISTTLTATSSSVTSVNLTFNHTAQTDNAHIAYLSLTSLAPLSFSGSQFSFRRLDASFQTAPVSYTISSCNPSVIVWDITDPTTPLAIATKLSGSTLTFTADETDGLHEYIAFDSSATFPEPADEGDVINQNLHSHSSVNYVIICPQYLTSHANRIGKLHLSQQGLSFRVVDVDQIFNEFSAGRPEAPAIRNYLKMLRERGQGSADSLSHVLLFGSGSYDNYNHSDASPIPTYQSATSYGLVSTYCTDDFYTWLDNSDGLSDTRSVSDVAIGRIPIANAEQAEVVVSKIEDYVLSPQLGSWRANAIFVACSGDANEHVAYAENQATAFESENPDMQVVRVYAESFQRQVSSTGTTYPEGEQMMKKYFQSGASLIHYTGHGGAGGWGNNFLVQKDYNYFNNEGRLPIVVSASCTLIPFDQANSNIATRLLFKESGGLIGVFAAGREVYGNWNYQTTRLFTQQAYALNGNRPQTLGMAHLYSKRNGPQNINSLKYTLLADPALVISRPIDRYCLLDQINGLSANFQTEPIRALEHNTLSASIRLADGTLDTSFNGIANVTLYDKRTNKSTTGVESGTPFDYSEWSSVLYSGEVAVQDGQFDFSFLLPKEIDLSVGYGRLSVYASSSQNTEAIGATDAILIGGIAEQNIADTLGPSITAWIDYPNFADGNSTGSTPILYAIIEDPSGINTSGQGVGHDISLTLDSDRQQQTILNSYFVYDANSYTRGTLVYQLASLADGAHSLLLKAWDNLNNSSSYNVSIASSATSDISFDNVIVQSDGGQPTLSFYHNCPDVSLSATIKIYSLDGHEVARGSFALPSSNYSGSLRLGSLLTGANNLMHGIYFLHCEVTSSQRNGIFVKKFIFAHNK